MEDSGVGISAIDQTKLFKLFGFLETSKEINTKGIGLGLYISKKLIQKFGGDVHVESELGSGSKFTFTFQLEKNESMQVSVQRLLNPLRKIPINHL